jgi:serine/threonine-protein kinase
MQQASHADALTYEGTLGEGGMGLVRLALQHSMGRRIAVKTLKQGIGNTELSLRLLREAWVTGALEHPNVVPIYDVSVDDDGKPVILMKNIEGASWSALLEDEEGLRVRVGGRDRLESNLRILMQVTHAVGLAHERGVVHRDIKPDNVMIGLHGEVYLVDWGIAVSLEPDPTGRLPLLESSAPMAGTPCYMAPEMLSAAEGRRVSPRSDIYLLGAVLHEIVTGRAPHEHGDLRSVLASILLSMPKLPNETDAELRAVIERALDANPDARYRTAKDFRLAIETFLVHRDSNQVTDDAWVRLRELERDLQTRDAQDNERVRKAHMA